MFDRRHPAMLLFQTSIGHLSWPNIWEHVSFGRNKTSVELVQKNLANLHCTFFMQHQNKKTSCTVKKKHYRPANVFKKNCAMSAEKNHSGSRPMSAIEFSIQSLNENCMMSIRKCLISVIRCCFFFRPHSVISPCRRQLSFFSINFRE